MDNYNFTTIFWKVLDIHSITQTTWTVVSGFLFLKGKHWRLYLMFSTWSLIHLAGKSLLKLIKMRKSKSDQTVEELLYYFVQCFERNWLSSSRCYKLWLFSPNGMTEMSLAVWWSVRKFSDILVSLSAAWSVVFVEVIFESSLSFFYISFDRVRTESRN